MILTYLEKGKTINGEYYASLLQQTNDKITAKWPHLAKKKVLYNQVNTPVHKSAIAIKI